jgi:hypothetical protein
MASPFAYGIECDDAIKARPRKAAGEGCSGAAISNIVGLF